MLAPPKQMLFLTIYNENIFLKTQGTRLGAIIALNKGLEEALITKELQKRLNLKPLRVKIIILS